MKENIKITEITNYRVIITPSTFIVPIIELLILYFISLIISFGIKKHKQKTVNGGIILAGLAIFVSEFSCVINFSEYYHCQNDYLALLILLVGLIIAGIGIYRFVKNR